MSQDSQWQHPELREGEVYVGNFENNGAEFADKHFRFSFLSERLGDVAYYWTGSEKNTPAPGGSGLRPWFALKTEVLASGLRIEIS
jgi:hypothetical protein